ncbi:MAG: head-tail connector protein [Hyphomicrobiaceae bacterium]|nr:head-tail connector protein [Hyphomicrobiaceae bacterium]
MALLLTSGPVLEPVSLVEAKDHLRVDHADEDVLISSLITAARIHLETHLGLAFITQQWSLVLDQWPAGADVSLPLSPVQAVSALTLYNADDASSVVASSRYALDAISQPARLVWRDGVVRPMPGRSYNGIDISFSAGFGSLAFDVPQPLRQAILLLTAHWYERREPVGLAGEVREIPQMVLMLTNSYRRVRL